jgi:hypothetical protein
MRPIRVTGVTGNSNPVPLDVYSSGQAIVDMQTAGAAVPQITADNVFDSSITPTWHPAPTKDATTGLYSLPQGVRAVRGSGMVSADVLVVSQQEIR